MWLKLITPPAALPVTVAEAKANLIYSASDQDAFIESLIRIAVSHLEARNGILGRALITQTWETRLERFPTRYNGRIELPFPPLQEVDWIKYLDATGAEQTVAPSTYVVDGQHLIGRVRLAPGQAWPSTLCDETAVRIQFKAGYGDTAATVPPAIKQAILLLVGHWWLNREAVGQAGGPHAFAVEALTSAFRVAPI